MAHKRPFDDEVVDEGSSKHQKQDGPNGPSDEISLCHDSYPGKSFHIGRCIYGLLTSIGSFIQPLSVLFNESLLFAFHYYEISEYLMADGVDAFSDCILYIVCTLLVIGIMPLYMFVTILISDNY